MTVFLNGKFLPLEKAHISPLDRGFLFGDGVYEVIPVYAGYLFRIKQHLQRLQSSLNAIRMQNPHSTTEWIHILNTLIQQQPPFDNYSIYLQVTRGADIKRDHAIPGNIQPTVFIMTSELRIYPVPTEQQGACAITQKDNRWKHCDVKAITLLANILLRQQAVDAGCAETILIQNGNVIEGAASNIFIVKDGILRTPPKSPMLLPGVTRDLILEIAQTHNIAAGEYDISEEQLRSAEEIWITSSTREILPITRLDDQVIGNGQPGQHWQTMIRLYSEYKEQLVSERTT